MSAVLDKNILSIHPRRKQSPPMKEMKIPVVPDPDVFPSSLDVISANENLLISFAIVCVIFLLYISKERNFLSESNYKYQLKMTYQEYMEKSSEIARLDYEMTKAIIGDEKHKPVEGDKFQAHRDRILELRIELFPQSVWALGTKQN